MMNELDFLFLKIIKKANARDGTFQVNYHQNN